MNTESESADIVAPINSAVTSEDAFLLALGGRVRQLRERRGMTRKTLARDASVSERHLAHLEAGEGNISIVLLRRISLALNTSLIEIFTPQEEDSVERRLIRRFLEGIPRPRLEEVIFRLMRDFGQEEVARRNRIALIGLRGAGKSTHGERLGRQLGIPFVELDHEIEREVGMPTEEIFSLYGQAGYRRIEKRALERVLRQHERAIFAIGGGVVAQSDTYDMLLAACFTIWLKALPEEHMARVIAQGDLRPMAGNDEAMADLRRILEARSDLYAKADRVIDSSNLSPDETFNQLRAALTT